MEYLLDNHYLLVPLVFLARVSDVSMGTIRTLLVFRGHKYIAAGIGFFEVLIWVVAASSVLHNLDTWYVAIAYAAGFATGNIVGSHLEKKLAMGTELVRAVSEDPEVRLAQQLRTEGYEVIELAGHGNKVPVEVVLVVEQRRKTRSLLELIDRVDPNSFYTISDVKQKEGEYGRGRRIARFRRNAVGK